MPALQKSRLKKINKMRAGIIGAGGLVAAEFSFLIPEIIQFRHSDLDMSKMRSSGKGISEHAQELEHSEGNSRVLDIKDYSNAERVITKAGIDLLINTAAYHRTEECERNPSEAQLVNNQAVKNLADICRKREITLVHFSTDYVFDGRRRVPYTEEDAPNPISAYGRSKLDGEGHVRELPRHFLIRTSHVFGARRMNQERRNLVEAILDSARSGKV